MRMLTCYTATRKLGRECANCHQPIQAGERYYKRIIRGARGDNRAENRYVEHVSCPAPNAICSHEQPAPARRAIRKAIEDHIAANGMVTAPDALVERIYKAIYGKA